MTKLKAIFFDLDDTLFDLTGCRAAGIAASLRVALEKHPHLRLEDWQRTSEEVKAEMHDRWLEPDVPGVELLREGSQRILAKLGVNDEELAGLVSAAYYQGWQSQLQLFPEVKEVLAALRSHLKLGVISNGPSDLQRGKLRYFHLEQEFHPIVISGEFGMAKPQAEIFHHALAQAGVAPEEALYVGDSPIYDISGAKSVGMWMAWVNRNGLPLENLNPKPDYAVRDLREVLLVLES